MKKVWEERLPRIAVLKEALHFHFLARAFGNYVKAQLGLPGIASHLQKHQAFSSDSNVFITSAPPAS